MEYRFYAVVLLILTLTSCTDAGRPAGNTSSKAINISYHNTIETVMILRALSDSDYFLHRIPFDNTSRPMLYKARHHFSGYKTHPAVSETQNLLYAASDIGGLLFQGILYAHELPRTGLKQEPADDYWKNHKAELEYYLLLVDSFYREAGVGEFLAHNKDFYTGAVNEAYQYINDSITIAMEAYFGKENTGYQLYLLPMCPYGWAFSATANSDGGLHQYAIISPVTGIAWDGVSEISDSFGFGGDDAAAHYRDLVVHEYVHSFITSVLEEDSFKRQIADYEYLYTPLLENAMNEQGYGDWWDFVNEHLVRLGHLRVAEMQDKNEAALIRKADIYENKFILLPEAELLMRNYEDNRNAYPTINEFLPELIHQFAKFDTATINERLRGNVLH